MIAFWLGFGACLLLVEASGYGLHRWGQQIREAREERVRDAIEAQMAAEADLTEHRQRAARIQRENDTRRGFIQGVDYMLDRLMVEEDPREGPAERAIRESREIYGDDA